MRKKKLNPYSNKYCILLVSLFIVSGCASQDKKSKLLEIQKTRIMKLEQQLDRKNKVIDRLKAKNWVEEPVKPAEKLALRPLRKLLKEKKWVPALRLSSKLKKQYPDSIKLRSYRYGIFQRMGLKKQAVMELKSIKKIRAKKLSEKSKIK